MKLIDIDKWEKFIFNIPWIDQIASRHIRKKKKNKKNIVHKQADPELSIEFPSCILQFNTIAFRLSGTMMAKNDISLWLLSLFEHSKRKIEIRIKAHAWAIKHFHCLSHFNKTGIIDNNWDIEMSSQTEKKIMHAIMRFLYTHIRAQKVIDNKGRLAE